MAKKKSVVDHTKRLQKALDQLFDATENIQTVYYQTPDEYSYSSDQQKELLGIAQDILNLL